MAAIPGLCQVPVEEASISSADYLELTGFDLKPFSAPESHIFGRCRLISEFSRISHLGEGAFGTVYKVKDKQTGDIVALKKMKIEKDGQCMPYHFTREINILKMLQHDNIVSLLGIAVGKSFESTALIFEYYPYKLSKLIDASDVVLGLPEIKYVMRQLLRALHYIHMQLILHRDLTVTNILFSNTGVLKISDFGFSRQMSDDDMTPNVVSRWYKAPEILFGTKTYTYAIDTWSAGCIFAELVSRKPMFQGDSDCDIIRLHIEYLGTPNESIWPGFSELPLLKEFELIKQPYNRLKKYFDKHESCISLLNRLFLYNPKKRFTAIQGLQHDYFRDPPSDCLPEDFLCTLKLSESV